MDDNSFYILRFLKNSKEPVFQLSLPASILGGFLDQHALHDALYRLRLSEYIAEGPLQHFKITQPGITFLEKEYLRRRREEEIKVLEFEKLRYDVRNVKMMNKTYWWTFGLAILGAAGTIITIIKGLQ